MKRHNALVQLSRDHHFGLLTSWKIKQGIAKDIAAERIARYIETFYQQRLAEHFEEEERWIFPLLSAGHPLVQEAVNEHRILQQIILNKPKDYESLSRFGNLLEQHIRMEERQLFQEIQDSVPVEKLDELLNLPFAEHGELTWADEFWK